MQIETNPVGDITIVKNAGRLDAEKPAIFRSEISQILEQNNANIVMDCPCCSLCQYAF